jgi:hypothetical protein
MEQSMQKNAGNKPSTNWKFILIVLIFAIVAGGAICWFAKNEESNIQNGVKNVIKIGKIEIDQNSINEICSPIDFSGYELAKNASGTDYEFNVDLNNDGIKESVRVYQSSANDFGERTGPNMIKIFFGTKDCPKEEFSHEFAEENEIHSVQFIANFLGDGRDVIIIDGMSTGYGSGATEKLHFLIWQNDKYSVFEGPEFGISCGLGTYKLAGENDIGNKIIVAVAKYGEDDYCCGCAAKLQFIIYNWNGEAYTKTIAGITQDKYFDESIDEIIQKESGTLNY